MYVGVRVKGMTRAVGTGPELERWGLTRGVDRGVWGGLKIWRNEVKYGDAEAEKMGGGC